MFKDTEGFSKEIDKHPKGSSLRSFEKGERKGTAYLISPINNFLIKKLKIDQENKS